MKIVFDCSNTQPKVSWDAPMSCVPRVGDDVLWDHEDEDKALWCTVMNVTWVFDAELAEPYAHVSLRKEGA